MVTVNHFVKNIFHISKSDIGAKRPERVREQSHCDCGLRAAERVSSLADAEGGEDAVEDVVGGGLAGEGVECAEGCVQV